MDETRRQELLGELVEMLSAERGVRADTPGGDLWPTFRALVNTRPPWPADEHFLSLQDELLRGMIADAGISGLEDAAASPGEAHMLLWRGDITTFAADGVVNAANAQMLGCWAPGHHCIDNAIHTFAGVQLRIGCARIMEAQGHDEPTGTAKMTPAYNLPAGSVIHTVGPIANGHPTDEHREQLASCYRSCLDIAAGNGLGSIAFCCISTGVFGFPQAQAARIAVDTTREWMRASRAAVEVVFNVFSDDDERLYRDLLGL